MEKERDRRAMAGLGLIVDCRGSTRWHRPSSAKADGPELCQALIARRSVTARKRQQRWLAEWRECRSRPQPGAGIWWYCSGALAHTGHFGLGTLLRVEPHVWQTK
jgi:hypothetical protein